MPPASKAVSTTARIKASPTDLSTSPDTDSPVVEQEPQTKSSKKKKRHAANLQNQTTLLNGTHNDEVAAEALPPPVPPPPPPRSEPILSIPRTFPTLRSHSPPPDDVDDIPTATEKVSDQYTPPNDNGGWLQDAVFEPEPSPEPLPLQKLGTSPPVQPGFSTRVFNTKSPPLSPPQRKSRPVSYGGSVPPPTSYPRTSTSPYSQAPSAYGSPPAPHMPQPHFYYAYDVDVGMPPTMGTEQAEEPSLIKHTRLPLGSESRQGIILGYEGRVSVLSTENGKVEELGAIAGLSGQVLDAIILGSDASSDSHEILQPMIALVLHGPTDTRHVQIETRNSMPTRLEYFTRVEVYSLSSSKLVASLLQTPGVTAQPVFRGIPADPPKPVGQLKLYNDGKHLVVASGSSGEVFVFSLTSQPRIDIQCISKFWTTVQPHVQRRESSHSRASDTDVSPADLGRGSDNHERAIVDLNGRWLAICPAASPSRPSLGATLGGSIGNRRNAGIEAVTAPTRPTTTCEVDSPDADTLLGKVARGVAQELVKGARWLGDQSYSTWQSYWKKDQSPPGMVPHQSYNAPQHAGPNMQTAFPPTHADTMQAPKEPELVSVFDLQALHESSTKRSVDEVKPIATFQPPRGCSFISFAPHGLNLLTAGRKGDVQYVWDLMQVKHCRGFITPTEEDRARPQPRVRQVARFDRLSGSTIIDVVWDGLTGERFASLTKNKTVHIFDLPQSASKWPPPRPARKTRSNTKSIDVSLSTAQQDPPSAGGFLASAMNIATRAQPIVANWRGRAPSMSGGLAGIGSTGIGLASATGARGGKVVAAGLSKSLGAASETVSSIRHAGESRLHLKSSTESVAGKLFWSRRGRRTVLCVLDQEILKSYEVRKSKQQDRRHKDSTTVFDVRKAVFVKLPRSHELKQTFTASVDPSTDENTVCVGCWAVGETRRSTSKPLPHPLSFAEIETNAPYQPFHTDRRVTLSVYSNAQSQIGDQHESTVKIDTRWVFGDDIPVIKMNLNKAQFLDDESANNDSVIYRETTVTSPATGDHDVDQIVSTTRRSKRRKDSQAQDHATLYGEKDDFEFENDCEVLDFATDRV